MKLVSWVCKIIWYGAQKQHIKMHWLYLEWKWYVKSMFIRWKHNKYIHDVRKLNKLIILQEFRKKNYLTDFYLSTKITFWIINNLSN